MDPPTVSSSAQYTLRLCEQIEARSILEQQRIVSRSNFVFVRFGERLRENLGTPNQFLATLQPSVLTPDMSHR